MSQVLVEMAAAHLENVKTKMDEIRVEKRILDEQLNKLMQYYEVHVQELEKSLSVVPVE